MDSMISPDEFTIYRLLPYSKAFTWKCKCGSKGTGFFFNLQMLRRSYERHLRIIHQLKWEGEPF